MRYTFIKAEDLTSAAFRGAEPVDRSTWLCLLAWCYEHENGGRIVGARQWGDRRWQQTVAVTLAEVQRETEGLWEWDGDDLIVPLYDAAYVEQVRADSRQGSVGGRSTSEAKAEAARINGQRGGRKPNTEPNGNPTQNPTKPNTEPNAEPNDGTQNNPTNPSLSVCLSVCQSDAADAASARAAAAEDPVFGKDTPMPRATVVRERNLGDLQALNPKIYIGRDERGAWQAVLDEYGWEIVTEACRRIAPDIPQGRRILLSILTGWIAENVKATEGA